MKTVREISEIVGVSKVTIYKALKSPDIKPHIIRQDRISFIDEPGEQILVKMFRKVTKTNSKVSAKVETNAEVLFLREQNAELLKQIDKLTALAENLTRLNENNQVLLAQQKIETLSAPEAKKASLFSRIFRRK